MKISVAMCTFNGSKYIKEQLQSIFTQSRLPDELIVCDDCSNDHTAAIVKSFAAHSAFPVRCIENEQNLGSTKNFEKAISLCTSDIIFLSDQDDIWEYQKIEKIMQAFADNKNIGYVFSDAELVDEELKSLGNTLWNVLNFNGRILQDFKQNKQVEVLIRKNYITGATVAFKAELKDKILPISDNWFHDGWIAFIASAIGIKGLALSECLIKYRQHNQQQIGVQISLFDQVKVAQNFAGSTEYIKALSGQFDLKKRLETFKTYGIYDIEHIIRLVDEKIEFIKARVKIYSSSGLEKWEIILKEIARGNYQRFSSSWRSIGKDLLYRKRNF